MESLLCVGGTASSLIWMEDRIHEGEIVAIVVYWHGNVLLVVHLESHEGGFQMPGQSYRTFLCKQIETF